jgi:hypothetical protein
MRGRMTDRVRHVWVRPEHSPSDCPGLILEWRRDDQGESQAIVTYVEPRGRAVTVWMQAEQVRPVAG